MQQCNTSLAYPHSYKLCRQNHNYSPPWLYSYCFPYILFFPHLERFPSWNIPGWDSGVAEWQRLGSKHSDEEKPAKAVQGMGNRTWDVYNLNFFFFFSILRDLLLYNFCISVFSGICVYLFWHWRVSQAVSRTHGYKIIQRQWDACVIKVGCDAF